MTKATQNTPAKATEKKSTAALVPETKEVLSITSKKEGFRRCGIAHSEKERHYDPTSPDFPFDDYDVATLMAEPMLVVSIRAVPVEVNDTSD
ncbi:MAG: hypothetical protein JKY45_08885 [Emcibacter sp.]|nr:hypothetical protein [Emcibacter sp.]